MSAGPQVSLISGDRLHLHHGPIDLIVGVDGPERQACFRAAAERFQTVMAELVSELPALRRSLQPRHLFSGAIARRMVHVVRPFEKVFVTPMAAVAGSVADEILEAMVRDQSPAKAYVNNGGDIAFHLGDKETFRALGPSGVVTLRASDISRGVATSGWRGRSHSLGIADAVTVLARTAAQADVAATLIANAVNLPHHPGIARVPASSLNPDSDLGERLVTTNVGHLASSEVQAALEAGRLVAQNFVERRLIESAVLSLRGQVQTLHAMTPTGGLIHA